ncbi:MAG: ABC transporter permease [Alphaproteobacteria bacterium]|nr:ABC transporter permease [Alphaproteobacteria bacterium]MBN9498868.1 ABC transporter permease [Alphaproteobacteria bacterium]
MKARWHWILLPSLLLSLGLLLASQIAFLRGGFFRDLRLGRMGTDFTLANYERFFTDPLYLDSLLLTVRLSLTVALLTLLVGFPIAYVLARLKSRWTLVLLAGIIAASFITIVIKVLGLIIIFSSGGFLNRFLMWTGIVSSPIAIVGNPGGVVIGLMHFTMGFSILLLYSVVQTIPRSLEEAAEIHGAPRWRVFARVILPLSLPGLVVTGLIVFNLCMGAFTSAALIGGGKVYTLPVLIQQTVINQTRYGMGATISAVLMLVTLAINGLSVLAMSKLDKRRSAVA